MKDGSHASYGSVGAVRMGGMSGGYGLKSEGEGIGGVGDDSGNDDNVSLDDHSIMSSWYQPPHNSIAESSTPTHNIPRSAVSSAGDQGSIATALALTATTDESRRASLSLPAHTGDVASRVRDSLKTPSDSLPPTREGMRPKGMGSHKVWPVIYQHIQQIIIPILHLS